MDWGNALIIGNVTADLPGNLLSSADAVLLELSTNNRTNWVPLAKYDWESLAYLYWDIASPRLAQCPWRITTDCEDLVTRRGSLLQAGNAGSFENSVLKMVEHARAGGQGEEHSLMHYYITVISSQLAVVQI